MDRYLSDWIRMIDQFGLSELENSNVFDIGKRIRFLTVDIITKLCLGESFGCIQSDSDQFGFLKTVETGAAIGQPLWVMHELFRILFWLTKISFVHRRLVPSAKDDEGLGKVMGVSLFTSY